MMIPYNDKHMPDRSDVDLGLITFGCRTDGDFYSTRYSLTFVSLARSQFVTTLRNVSLLCISVCKCLKPDRPFI